MASLFPEREIFLQLGDFTVRWYGLLWAASFWLVWYLAPKLQKYRGLKLSQDDWTRIIAWGAVGALVGGRLGYALFYELAFFLAHPGQVFAIWQGGMASHGGFIGAAMAVWLVIRFVSTKSTYVWVDFLRVLDVLVVPMALALALGRLGNWINLEIFGANPIAIGKNLLIAGICYWLIIRRPRVASLGGPPGTLSSPADGRGDAIARGKSGETGPAGWSTRAGSITAIFLITYSILRFLIEPLRDDPWPLVWGLTRGQLLTLPLLALGVWLLVWRLRLHARSKQPMPS